MDACAQYPPHGLWSTPFIGSVTSIARRLVLPRLQLLSFHRGILRRELVGKDQALRDDVVRPALERPHITGQRHTRRGDESQTELHRQSTNHDSTLPVIECLDLPEADGSPPLGRGARCSPANKQVNIYIYDFITARLEASQRRNCREPADM